MEAICKFNSTRIPVPPFLHNPHRPPFSTPFSSLSFRTPPPPFSLSSIKSSLSSSSNPLLPKPENPRPPIFEALTPLPSSLLKTTLIAAVTATALFFARFNLKPLIAAPISPPPTVETTSNDTTVSDEEKERHVEEYLNSSPNDVDALRVLVELRIRNQKAEQAIPVIDKLISLEPDDIEFPLLKSHMQILTGEPELAKLGFHEILSKDPLCVEAYHGLVMAASERDSSSELKEIEKMIVEAIDNCKKDKKKKEDLREFKLLRGQIRIIEGDYSDALKIYEELVKEEPRDFRPYLCQGIIFTLLSKKDEAEKCFQKYRRLVPRGHPYATYFDDNMMGKIFSQKVENERAASKTQVQIVENERGASKTDEQMVENESAASKTEEQMVNNEGAASKTEEQIVGSG